MNREILFRGKALESYGTVIEGEWVVSSTIVTNGVKISLGVGYDEDSVITIPVDPETVGQYAGFDDVTGVRIFDGDKSVDSYVKWIDGAWWVITENKQDMLLAHCVSLGFVVTGNIHDQ